MTHKRKMIVWIVSIIVLVVVLSIVLTKVIPIYQYRLQGEDIQKYEECLKQYQEDIATFRNKCRDAYAEYNKFNYNTNTYLNNIDEILEEIAAMYSSTRNWPEKYKELYFYTIIAYKYDTKAGVDELLGPRRPAKEISCKWFDIWYDLNEKLENKYYVPEDLEKYKKEMQELLGEEKLPEYVRVM